MAFFQLVKVVVAWIQLTLFYNIAVFRVCVTLGMGMTTTHMVMDMHMSMRY
jgi:hypothetical protein